MLPARPLDVDPRRADRLSLVLDSLESRVVQGVTTSFQIRGMRGEARRASRLPICTPPARTPSALDSLRSARGAFSRSAAGAFDQHFTPLHVQSFVIVQSASHVAPPSHVMLHLPPAHVSLQVDPALHVCAQLPAVQSKLHSAPLSHVCAQPTADVLQSALQRLSSLQAIEQPATVQLCVQSSFALHSQGSPAVHPMVRVVRGGFGTSASPPPVPPPPPELEAPPELDEEPVLSPSSDLHAVTRNNAAIVSMIAERRR